MFKKVVIAVTLASFMTLSSGCMHTVSIPPEKMHKQETEIVKLSTVDGRVIEFALPGALYDRETNRIVGYSKYKSSEDGQEGIEATSGDAVNIPVDSVMMVWVKRTDTPATLAVVTVSVVVLVAIIAALSDDEEEPQTSDSIQSCPFIYSYDGSRYVFDAEPLGGAVCRALQRTDFSRLEFLKPVDGMYHLNMKNEMPETQYLDQIQLLTVDHAIGQKVVPDTAGRMHLITDVQTPSRAFDELGRDLLPFISADDGLSWQTLMVPQELTRSSDTRHHLTLEFPKPADAKTAYLVTNTGTALWGSRMMREMIQARGRAVNDWYASINAGSQEFWKLLHFTFTEELYILKINVQKSDRLVERGFVLGGGPFISEDRLISIDVSDIPGDKLTINLNPPKGFWTMDYFAVQYDRDSVLPAQACPIETALDQNQQDVYTKLSTADGDYYTMMNIGDWAELTFTVQPQADTVERSLFLSTTGYYVIHSDTTVPEQRALIDSIMSTAGAITAYSNQLYLELYNQSMLGATSD